MKCKQCWLKLSSLCVLGIPVGTQQLPCSAPSLSPCCCAEHPAPWELIGSE